jgi:hypothetical protein
VPAFTHGARSPKPATYDAPGGADQGKLRLSAQRDGPCRALEAASVETFAGQPEEKRGGEVSSKQNVLAKCFSFGARPYPSGIP